MSKGLRRKMNDKSARIAVVGLGYVGLPLAVQFARAGYRVTGLDIEERRIKRVNAKESYILDVKQRQLAGVINKGLLSARSDFSVVSDMDVVIICVPTPLKRKYTPDISFMLRSIREVRKHLKKGALIVLESTTYPGTTEEMIKPELEKGGKRLGKDFYLAFSPERIDPGNTVYDVTKIPKLVGGMSQQSGALTKLLYEKVIKKVVVVSSAKAAEMTKLLENTFRIINIGWINEITVMCHKMGIDVWEVIEAAKTKPFGFMPFYPGLGVGGHCIPDDPLYLYWKARHHGFSSKFIKLAADVNHYMPHFALERLREISKKRKKSFKKMKILLLGVTYKKDVHDLRKSPVLTLLELLQAQGVKVDYHDPYIPFLKIGKIDQEGVPLTDKNLKKYDCVVVAVDHSKVNYRRVLRHARLIFDIKNVYNNKDLKKIVRF